MSEYYHPPSIGSIARTAEYLISMFQYPEYVVPGTSKRILGQSVYLREGNRFDYASLQLWTADGTTEIQALSHTRNKEFPDYRDQYVFKLTIDDEPTVDERLYILDNHSNGSMINQLHDRREPKQEDLDWSMGLLDGVMSGVRTRKLHRITTGLRSVAIGLNAFHSYRAP